jgi:lipopolysaccharide transport system permease protein
MKLHFIESLIHHRVLWWRLTQREVVGRYKGSALGLGWAFITPLLMLAVYTLVFSQVFKARWGGLEEAGPMAFAINLFAGLIVFNLFTECVSRAPELILQNPNYVKKVVFPLELLAAVAVASACVHLVASLSILIIANLLAFHSLPLTILWLPLVWLPLMLLSLATCWILSAAGVFMRDLGQLVRIGLNMLIFLSPVFFPISAMPEKWRPIIAINPLAAIIEQTRNVLVQGREPSFAYIILATIATLLCCELAFRAFSKAKRSFADVI